MEELLIYPVVLWKDKNGIVSFHVLTVITAGLSRGCRAGSGTMTFTPPQKDGDREASGNEHRNQVWFMDSCSFTRRTGLAPGTVPGGTGKEMQQRERLAPFFTGQTVRARRESSGLLFLTAWSEDQQHGLSRERVRNSDSEASL